MHPNLIEENIPLAHLHTFHIPVTARYYSAIASQEVLIELLRDKTLPSLPYIVIGNGSNLLFVDDFPGWVQHITIGGIEKIFEDHQHIHLRVGAGVEWHQLVMWCVERDYAGIENLSLIPGTVGAAPVQNIGAYGVSFSEVLEELEAVEIHTGKVRKFTKQDCRFGYRDSIFKNDLRNQYIITNVTLRLHKKPKLQITYGAIQETLAKMEVQTLSIKAISDAIIHIRQQKLPDTDKLGNAGSFFKNPVINQQAAAKLQEAYPSLPANVLTPLHDTAFKVSAAWLIEQCGWKGYRRGDVGVYADHALVLVNYGQATGQELLTLSTDIQASVLQRFQIALIPEVVILPLPQTTLKSPDYDTRTPTL